MYIETVKYDKNYPYTIHDSWGGKCCTDKDGLIDLKRQIEQILNEEREVHKNDQKKKR